MDNDSIHDIMVASGETPSVSVVSNSPSLVKFIKSPTEGNIAVCGSYTYIKNRNLPHERTYWNCLAVQQLGASQKISVVESVFQGMRSSGRRFFGLTWGQPTTGNATVEVFLISEGDEKEAPEWDGLESLTQEVEFFEGVKDFEFSMEELRSRAPDGSLAGFTLGVKASVFDYWYNETRFGYSQTKVYNDSLRLMFLGDLPQIFVPGTVFTTHLGVSRQDGSLPSLPTNVEIRTQMTFDAANTGDTRSQVMAVPNDGVLFLDIFVPFGVAELAVEAISVGNLWIGNFEPYELTNASKTRMTVLRRQTHTNYVLQV
ncbi:hypothetical protein RvY_07257 [Ramazzottius varieornatus]|uniref:Uncharacterized protein n=1 Tax=Ramazzottius varieornatus TaxID=947166 RepID=A0A1D1V1E5_RAMVA|nr:hypothetical protein RvY_07257 [Ramazzottius varieornatus]